MLTRVEQARRIFPDVRDRRDLLEGDFSLFSSLNIVLQELLVGATVVVATPRSLDDYIATLRERGITDTYFLPQRLARLLAIAGNDQGPLFPNLRAFVSSAGLPPEIKAAARIRVAPAMLEAYGTNEAGYIALDLWTELNPHPGSLGKACPWVDVEIVDDHDQALPAGQPGQIRIRNREGSSVTSYLDNPAANARHFRDGWFYPGDVLSMTEDGYLLFQGRVDDVINRGGVKFYPIEIETVLQRHPAVAEAAVTSWPDPVYGQIALAFVELKTPLPPGELMAWCARELGSKKPDRIVTVREMPRTPNHKILKRELREQYAAIAQRAGKRPDQARNG